jgi:hypothetical protein
MSGSMLSRPHGQPEKTDIRSVKEWLSASRYFMLSKDEP